MSFLNEIKWAANGLVPAIVQDFKTGKVLMFAWMNREALQKTIDLGEAVYYSRSRRQLWHKGASSGYLQKVKEIYMDCDADALMFKVEQIGNIACHTGRNSCFFRRYQDGEWKVVEGVIKHPDEIYGRQ